MNVKNGGEFSIKIRHKLDFVRPYSSETLEKGQELINNMFHF